MRNFLTVISIVILVVISFLPLSSVWAQDNLPQSKTLRNNIEKFELYLESDYDKALHYARLVDADSDSTSLGPQNAMVYDFLSKNSEEKEFRYGEALRYKQLSHSIYLSIDDKRNKMRTLADLGRLCFRTGDYHNAFTYSTQVRKQADTLLDRLALREAHLTMELIDYFYHRDTTSSMRFNRYVSESYSTREEARQAMRALNNRFHYPLTPRQVSDLLSRSLEIHSQYDFDDQIINIYLNVALQQLLFEDLEACATYLEMAKPMIRNFKDEGYYYSALGFYYINMGNRRQAIEDTRRSIEILSKGDFDDKNVHSYFLLQELYRLDGRYKDAYQALMKFAEIYTRQNNTESAIELSKLVNEMELQYAEEDYLQNLKYERLLWRMHAYGLIVVAALALLLYSRYRLQRKNHQLTKAKSDRDLNHKNDIIKIQKLQQYQEQHNMSKLTEELVAVANIQDSKQMRAQLRQIIGSLQKSGSGNGDWVEVEKIMVDNDDAFFRNLLKEYPNLTKNERKLCTFIHLNLSTKEISKITHQSIGSINIARSRLRQKFGITGDDKSLIAFLDRFNDTPEEQQ